MKAKTKKRLIIIGSLLAIGGIVGVFLVKKAKDKKSIDNSDLSNEQNLESNTSSDANSNNTVFGGGSGIKNKTGLKYPKTVKGISYFQTYARKKKHKTEDGKLISVDGVLNNDTKTAWNMLAKTFINYGGVTDSNWNNFIYKK